MNDNASPRFPIRSVAAQTGLSDHVIRAWERRYEVVTPQRVGQRRLYSEADLSRLRLLRQLTEAGFQISQIARLSEAELLGLMAEVSAASPDARGNAAADALSAELLDAIRVLDAPLIYALLRRGALRHDFATFAEELLVPVLRETGVLWSRSEICAVHEHLLSIQVSRLLDWMSETVDVGDTRLNAIASVPTGFRHEFGARIAGIMAMTSGWHVTFTGNDLPALDLALVARVRAARVVLLSAIRYTDGSHSLVDEVQSLRTRLPGETTLIVGGSAAAEVSNEIQATGALYLPDFKSMRSMLHAIQVAQAQPA